MENIDSNISSEEELVGIDEVQKFLNRSRASVYRYTNTDLRNLNPSFNPRKLNPEFRTDQKDPLKFHPNEVARFAKDILRIKEVTVEVFNTPSSAAQNVLLQILEELIGIDEVQKFLNRSRASVYRYTNTDLRNLNPSFNPRKLNPEFRTDQKDPLKFHPNEVARFAKDILRIKEVTVEVFNTPSSAAQNILVQILDELKSIRSLLEKE